VDQVNVSLLSIVIYPPQTDLVNSSMASGFTPWDKFWSRQFTVTVPDRGTFNAYSVDGQGNTVVVAIHGAGHSALSFSLVAQRLSGKVPFIAIDLKCHGETPGDASADLSIDSLTADVAGFCEAIRPDGARLVLVGHSLGGSIAAHVALQIRVSGVVVIDTIECTSIESLPQMKELIATRPSAFPSVDDAIDYVAMCGEMQNRESALVSAGGRFRWDGDVLVWRTDLAKCEADWEGWFKGFAQLFVQPQNYKILVVPDINRLDTPFTIAPMSGKFQLDVCLDTCHCVHEDNPKHVAELLLKLVQRLERTRQWD
jgi:protein phosphatase methylesterase 1